MKGACTHALGRDIPALADMMSAYLAKDEVDGKQSYQDIKDGARVMVDRGWVRVWRSERRAEGFLARDAHMVHALYVRPETAGKGIGTALLLEAQALCSRLVLWTDARNVAAARFYARAGFSETLGVPRFASSDGVNERWFEWTAPCGEWKTE